MATEETRVCPYCGDPPGQGVFCAACGRNLSTVERLPTRGEWEAQHRTGGAPPPAAGRATVDVAAFLAAMEAAGNPGRTALPTTPRKAFGRQPTIEGWVVRPVDRDDEAQPRRYESGLFLATDGSFHALDSELRGWGQRDFPTYYESVAREPVEPPVDGRLGHELAALLHGHGVPGGETALRRCE
jgi:hypothetical protein